ncbi:preprotein translocase subunit SecE [Corynebacterium mayonis]|uniref:preprotein translocase subunit SecE n=1 Tax=Corynebacterium mayonis TaxID=3062461 RepID=UPI0031405459
MTNPNAQNPAQPTGKRQLRGSSPTSSGSYEAKRDLQKSAEPDEKPGGGVAAFPGEVVSEMRKVIWPTSRQMLNYTLIVFGFLIVLTALVWGVDWVGRWVIEQIFVR